MVSDGGDLWIGDATTLEGARVDLVIDNGAITAVLPAGTRPAPPSHVRIDAHGRLVHGGLVEPHAHLDKAYLAERAPNPTGDLMGAIGAMQSVRHTTDAADIAARAERAVDAYLARGTMRIRTHVDTTLDNGFRSVEALVAVRDRRREDVDIEVAALLDWPLTGVGSADRRAMAREAVARGVDVIGGCPHLDDDPRSAVEWLVEEAVTLGVPLDLHADENLRSDSGDLEILADILIASGLRHPVTASHCVSLSVRDDRHITRVAEKVAEAGIAVVALPQTNLYLQGRNAGAAAPRGIAPVRSLLDAGVVVAAGGDNMQDPFNPFGRGDPYDVAALMVLTSHVSVQEALRMVTTSALAATCGAALGLEPGARADLVLLPAADARAAVAEAPDRRTVIRGGRVLTRENSDRK